MGCGLSSPSLDSFGSFMETKQKLEQSVRSLRVKLLHAEDTAASPDLCAESRRLHASHVERLRKFLIATEKIYLDMDFANSTLSCAQIVGKVDGLAHGAIENIDWVSKMPDVPRNEITNREKDKPSREEPLLG